MEPYTQELRHFIVDNFLFGDQSGRFAFSDTDSLQALGIVDSTGVLELVCHVQEKYGISVADEELVPDNLDSVDRIARFIDRKRRDAPLVRAS
jgi:acyl carrier protein